MGVTINEMFLRLLMVMALFNANPAGGGKMMSECHHDGRKLTFIEYLLDVKAC